MTRPRAAFFTDSFHEVNGVAQTSRQFDAFARRKQIPFLRACVGPETKIARDGEVWSMEFERSVAAFPVERDMAFDPLFTRHKSRAIEALQQFKPDLIHVTGPSDVGILGVMLARHLRLPLVASWHTNLHEFGARRLEKMLAFLPDEPKLSLAAGTERRVLDICVWFYDKAKVLLAPNRELIDMLSERTGKECFLMRRGIDTVLFAPEKRTRQDSGLVFGYVGRITAEKNVRLLVDLERALEQAGIRDFKIRVVGHGGEESFLRETLRHGELPGVIKGEDLAKEYANFDVFVFPSHTDTFGNVVQEAMASNVPVIVTSSGGPKYLVEEGVTGHVARDDEHFVQLCVDLARNPDRLPAMRAAARQYALKQSWDAVFEDVFRAYGHAFDADSVFRAPA